LVGKDKMNKEIKSDDVIFNFFQQICDQKDDQKCIELGNKWISAMETNLTNIEKNLERNLERNIEKNLEKEEKKFRFIKF